MLPVFLFPVNTDYQILRVADCIPGSGQSGFGRSVDVILPGLKYSSTRRHNMEGIWAKVQLARCWGMRSCRTRRVAVVALRTAVSVSVSVSVRRRSDACDSERSAVTEDWGTSSMTLSVYCANMMRAIDAPILDSRTLPLVPALYHAPNCPHHNSIGLKTHHSPLTFRFLELII